MSSEETIIALLGAAEQQARTVLLALRQDLMTTWVIIAADGQPIIQATPWENDRQKRLAEIFIRHLLREYQAVAYSFVSEAWMAMAPKDWDPDTPLPESARPMNQPERQETVFAFATDGKIKRWKRWFIRRDWNEQIITLEPADMEVEPFGWMTGLLGKK